MSNKKKRKGRLGIFIYLCGALLLCAAGTAAAADGAYYGGVFFPYGDISFADEVVAYYPGQNVLSPYNKPARALGAPDETVPNNFWNSFVSLGDGGNLIVKFTDNCVTPSGDSDPDLWVFEVGKLHEPMKVYISQNGANWIDLGLTHSKGYAGFDLDKYNTVTYGVQYRYVRLADAWGRESKSPHAGADVDAIGAMTAQVPPSQSNPVPEPAGLLLLAAGLVGMGLKKRSDKMIV